MALKGKKKASRRGSQARRRPAAPPRPTYGGREKRRWYQTTSGLVIAFVIIAMVAIATIWWVADSRSDAKALETTQTELQNYTSSLRATTQSITPIVQDLAAAGELDDEAIAKDSKKWKNELATAQTTLSQALPPEDLIPVNAMFLQAFLLYAQSAEQYALLPEVEGDARDRLAAQASTTQQAAGNVFANAIQLLDAAREDAELAASGLTPPGGTSLETQAGTTTTTIEDTGETP